MFNLPVSSNAQWAVQVLTYDYLIEGHVDEKQEHFNFNLIQARGGPVNMHLTSARFQPTGNLAPPEPASTPWALVYAESVVAVIPRDEASTAYVLKNNADFFKYPVAAEVRVGAYLIQGKVLSPDKMLNVFESYFRFAVQDAEISCRLPGAQLTGLKAPYVLVVGSHKQLLTPAA